MSSKERYRGFSSGLHETTDRLRNDLKIALSRIDVVKALGQRTGVADRAQLVDRSFTADEMYELLKDFDFRRFALTIRRLRNTSRARGYLLIELAAGTSLARLVISRIDFGQGSFLTLLPRDVDPDRLSELVPPGTDPARFTEFRDEIVQLDENAAKRQMTNIIKGFISDSHCAVLLQETQLKPADPWLKQFGETQVVACGTEVYWQLKGAGVSDQEIERIVGSASIWPFSAFFYVSSFSEVKTSLAQKDLEEAADSLIGLAVGANHEDTYLFWWKSGRSFPANDIS